MTARLVGWVPEVGRVDKVLGDSARIGATPDNDVVVRVDGVSRTHSRILKAEDGYWLEDAPSRNGTWLNGERVSRARLRHLDVVTLGRFAELIFVDQPDAAAPAVSADQGLRARIEWLEGPGAGTSVDLAYGDVIIGRAESCGLVVDHAAISRAHARLTLTSESLTVEDLGSVNGTFVRGQPLSEAIALESGAVVELGQAIRFRVILEGTPRPSPGQVPGATPLGSQDMEWSTQLVWSARDMAPQSGDRISLPPMPGPAKKKEAPAPGSGPPPARTPVQEVAKQAGDPTIPVDTGQTRVEVRPLGRPPEGLPADPANVTQAARGPIGAPPRLGTTGPEVGSEPRTQLETREPVRMPAALKSPQERTELPPATVLGFRDVAPAPRGIGGPASTAFRGTRAADETTLPTTAGTPPALPDISEQEPSMIESVRLTGDLGVFVLPRGTSTVGRATDATIRIDSREMSRIHAIVTVSEHDVVVEDRGSVNGTSVNGTMISGRRSLVHGDRVSFADFEFRVEFQRAEGHS